MKKLSAKKIVFRYALLILVCATIFWFSSNNGEDSGGQSGRIVDFICGIFFPDMDMLSAERQLAIRDILTVAVRKGAHLFVYTLLGAVSFAAFFPLRKKGLRYIMSVCFAFLYACTDELHQELVPDRTGKISDVLIDTFGAAAGAFVILCVIIVIEGLKRDNGSAEGRSGDTEKMYEK